MKIRDKGIGRLVTEIALRHQDPQGGAADLQDDEGELLKFLMRRTSLAPSPSPPASSPSSARGEDPTRMFAGEGGLPHQPPLQEGLRNMPATACRPPSTR